MVVIINANIVWYASIYMTESYFLLYCAHYAKYAKKIVFCRGKYSICLYIKEYGLENNL